VRAASKMVSCDSRFGVFSAASRLQPSLSFDQETMAPFHCNANHDAVTDNTRAAVTALRSPPLSESPARIPR